MELERQPATVEILGVKVHCVNFEQTLNQIAQWIEEADSQGTPAPCNQAKSQKRSTTQLSSPNAEQVPTGREHLNSKLHQICTVNPEFIMAARHDPVFADVLQTADLCVPDGIGVLWAARRQGVKLRERVTGSDGIYRICERAAHCGWRVYLLGAAEGIAAEAAHRLVNLYPALQVVGSYSGTPHARNWPEIAKRLQAAQPDILFVAYGHPRQDLWIAQHRHELAVKVAMGVGGAFDFVAAITPRAPRWMQRWGVEWLYRLIQQPWRWRRMVVLPLFAFHIVWGR